ncbi:MAG TPA: hypothetical protein VG714_02365 [Acidobacteriaceae bacterium]|nr:hypothetical protein [Acidobacteriaceae bacterium]
MARRGRRRGIGLLMIFMGVANLAATAKGRPTDAVESIMFYVLTVVLILVGLFFAVKKTATK